MRDSFGRPRFSLRCVVSMKSSSTKASDVEKSSSGTEVSRCSRSTTLWSLARAAGGGWIQARLVGASTRNTRSAIVWTDRITAISSSTRWSSKRSSTMSEDAMRCRRSASIRAWAVRIATYSA
jgi:hypothetical protein